MPSTPKTLETPTVDTALPGRRAAIPTARTHFVNGHPLKGPYPDGMEIAIFAMGAVSTVGNTVNTVFWQSIANNF